MTALAAIAGTALLLLVLWEAFETIVLPRRVTRRVRLTSLFYRCTWRPWAWLAGRVRKHRRRESLLGLYGPLSLVFLLAFWAAGLIIAFALLEWSAGSHLRPGDVHSVSDDLYFSGTTFFTLGLGDLAPVSSLARAFAVIEAGMGFGFLALVIGYFPVLYQSFSQREVNISLLDARAGSPPAAAELLRRHAQNLPELDRLLRDWERWAAELLESHLSYPVLAYFRSQHDNQSWLAALTAMLDTCVLCAAGVPNGPARQAQLTFAMARHALVDLAQVFNTPPHSPGHDRLTADDMQRLRELLLEAGLPLPDGAATEARIHELRAMYEPYAFALSRHLRIQLPRWIHPATARDNWQTSRWGRGVLA